MWVFEEMKINTFMRWSFDFLQGPPCKRKTLYLTVTGKMTRGNRGPQLLFFMLIASAIKRCIVICISV